MVCYTCSHKNVDTNIMYNYVHTYIIYNYTIMYIHTLLKLCTYIHYIEIPVVEITTAAGGCGYVYVSWSVNDSNPDDGCSIGRFNVTLSSVDISVSLMSQMLTHNFTGLLDDTLFTVTVFGISLTGTTVINFASTSLRTMIIKSMFIYTYACKYIITRIQTDTSVTGFAKRGLTHAVIDKKYSIHYNSRMHRTAHIHFSINLKSFSG